jgi:2-polyprenyl-3-methyl-5-hydroxy-6-metoxy-1,4-benzoquinol methylase
VSERQRDSHHYSYSHYAKSSTARTFDDRRFGGPIGSLIASSQAKTLSDFVGRIQHRRILDVGTGTGRAALLFARGGARVTAVDASEQMLAVARARAEAEGVSNIKFQAGDVHALNFQDRSFDVVCCLRVLMHTPKWRLALAELCRVADQLVIIDYPSTTSVAWFESMVRRVAHGVGVNTEAYRTFTHRTIQQELKRNGFVPHSIHRQFVLPIAFHKLLGSRRMTLRIEGLLDRLGLLKRFGSPVSLVAERCVS